MSYSKEIDHKWNKKWEEWDMYSFNPDAPGEKRYCLEMFSYPSASKLHIGHWYNYALSDSWARMKKMQGYNVFQPMGFDAFGLPAENYAIKTGIHPHDSTIQNIQTMEEQLKDMGGLFAWDHEISTCMPDYYRWTQWLFLQLYKNDLAYRKNAPVNWCPSCHTVLANEQVIDSCCERCGTEVTHKNLTQWFFRITKYAQELLDCLPGLDWPEKTKKIQTNWIGRSAGAQIHFTAFKNGEAVLDENGKELELKVFTTRADTLLGVSYVVCAPESELCSRLITAEQKEVAEAYIEETKKASDIDRMSTDRPKTGVFTGSYAKHPLTGKLVPIWMSDYVIATYGTGVVMAVPAHDERDYAFATKYDLPIQRVIKSKTTNSSEEGELPFCEAGILVNSGEFDGLTSEEGLKAIVNKLKAEDKGDFFINYRLRDWLVSRQRYWGAPIPVVHCEKCGIVPVPEKDLPVLLPYEVEFKGDGKSPLAECSAFIETTCPNCGDSAKRDPDTLDTFVCSSWYYLRYADPHNEEEPFNKDLIDRLLPVDKYIGGAEHAAMHLLYSRFITKALRDMGYLKFDEPFLSLVHQGTILGEDGQKMSKSKGNTVSPDEYVDEFGSDAFRLYMAFAFAYTEGGPWSDSGIKSIAKFLQRIERQTDEIAAGLKDANLSWKSANKPDATALNKEEKELNFVLNNSIKGVTTDSERFQFNTSISRIMEVSNALSKYLLEATEPNWIFAAYVQLTNIQLLAPFAPHWMEELWEQTGHDESIFISTWPEVDEKAFVRDTIEIGVQINGQVKHRLDIPTEASPEDVEKIVLGDTTVQNIIAGKEVVKFIYIRGRLANIVIKK